MTNYGNNINGVEHMIIKGERGQEAMESKHLGELGNMKFRAESYRRVFKAFKDKNWNPDLVISHTGWGCGLHVKEIWPSCKFIGYLEWWFHPISPIAEEARSNRFLDYNESLEAKLWLRNINIGFELCTADKIISPTEWQRKQLPTSLYNRCTIVRDGLDAEKLKIIEEVPSEKPLITYGTRGMEPIRCFKEFIKSIPLIVKNCPNANFEIAGEDKICYGGKKPSPNTTWGEWAKKYLESARCDNKVKWRGLMPYHEYRQWLHKSWCHVYLTQPFIASWSLLEAMACGLPIVASNNLPVLEVCRGSNGVALINNNSIIDISSAVIDAVCGSDNQKTAKSRFSREDFIKKFGAKASLEAWSDVTGMNLDTNH